MIANERQVFCGGITIDTDLNNKMKLSNMLPKHKHKDQIFNHVSKTQSQKSNSQKCFQNTITETKFSNIFPKHKHKDKIIKPATGNVPNTAGPTVSGRKILYSLLVHYLCTIVSLAQPLHNKLLGKTLSSLYFTSSSHLTQARPFAHRTEDSWTNGDPSTGTKL